MHALYAYARLVDNLADDGICDGPLAVQFAKHLRQWVNFSHASTDDTLRTWTEEHASPVDLNRLATELDGIAKALEDCMSRFSISPKYLQAMIDGTLFDLDPTCQIEAPSDLERYCYQVASSVGLACIQIWRGDIERCKQAAIDCGIAFQMTNILRDVAEDARRQRVYFPTTQLQTFGCSRDAWIGCQPDGDWQSLMRSSIELAREKYENAKSISTCLPADSARMFSLIWKSYRSLLEYIASNLDQVWQRRLRLPLMTKSRLYFSHAITPIYNRSKTL